MPTQSATSTNVNKTADALKDQASNALVLQGYCNSVLAQAKVDFSADENLTDIGDKINRGLKTAQTHANTYLNNIQPSILSSVSALNNYFTLYSSVPTACPPGSTVDQWVQTIQALKKVSEDNLRDAKILVTTISDLSKALNKDSDNFSLITGELNVLMKGDKGELESIQEQLKSLDTQIAGTITAVVGGALGIAGGIFCIAVGSIAGFVTAGTSAELVIGGVVAVVTGVAAETGSGIALKSLYDQKSQLLAKQSNLTSEVNLVTGISSSYKNLGSQVEDAITAAAAMQSSWQLLSEDLESLVSDLQQGILTTDAARTMFLQEANTDITRVQSDVTIIKQQMAGVQTTTAPAGTNVTSLIPLQPGQNN